MTVGYHAGGYKPDAPAQNKSEQWDDATRVYTAWDAAGVQTSIRPYMADENAAADAETADRAQESNAATLSNRLEGALAGDRAFMAIAAPTSAQLTAQVRAMTRVEMAQIQLALGQLDDID